MLVFVLHFVYNNTSYTSYFDTSNNTGICQITGQNPTQSIPGGVVPIGEVKTFCSDNPSTTKVTTTSGGGNPFFTFTLQQNSPDCVYTPPSGGCDIAISSVSVTNELSAGANNGSITVNVTSSYGGIQYSLDNTTFQSGNIFSNLAPNNYTIYVKDSNNCNTSQPFTVLAYTNPVQNFTNELPVVALPGGNISKWNAAFNPIVINYQRKDFVIIEVSQSGANVKVKTSVTLTADQYGKALTYGIYFKSAKYEFYGIPLSYNSTDGFVVSTPYVGTDSTGYLNVNVTKKNYFVQTEVTTPSNPVIIAEHTPGVDGHTRADLSPYLQSLLSPDDANTYLQNNYKDYNLGGSYTIRYREVWDGGNSEWFAGPYPLYYTYAAAQLGERYGGNMAQYVPFLTTVTIKEKAKFLTGFELPTFWEGLPFDLSFIYSENVINQQLYFEVIPNCGALSNSLLLNADATYLLNADQSRFIIGRTYNSSIQGYQIIEALGINRIRMPNAFDCCATQLVANIYYLNGDSKFYIMQDQLIKYQCTCDDPYVYLKWINSRGGWDYWRFGFNQDLSNSTTNSEQINRFISNWETDQTMGDYISRQSVPKMSLVAGQLTLSELNSLSWLSNSRRVQMLTSVNPIKWQTVLVPDGDFSRGSTRSGIGNVKLSITLPSYNIQRG